jgi:FG-GAP repeat
MVRFKAVVCWGLAGLGVLGALGVARAAHAQSWAATQVLMTPSTGDGDYFGRSLAVSQGRLLAGAAGEDVAGLHRVGAAYLFAGPGFSEVTRLSPPAPKEYWAFGSSVALDGNTAMFGEGPLDNTSVHVFELQGSTWAETALIHEADSTFGFSLVLHGDTAVFASPKSGADVGKVHVYRKRVGGWAEAQELTASDALWSARWCS